MHEQIRLRKKGKIRELKYSEDIMQQIEKIRSQDCSNYRKRELTKDLIGWGGLCSICRGLPEIELCYESEEATIVERYCESCSAKVFQRMKEEPKGSLEDIAEYYGCIKGDIEHTPREEYIPSRSRKS